jgi:hypothetical protein
LDNSSKAKFMLATTRGLSKLHDTLSLLSLIRASAPIGQSWPQSITLNDLMGAPEQFSF